MKPEPWALFSLVGCSTQLKGKLPVRAAAVDSPLWLPIRCYLVTDTQKLLLEGLGDSVSCQWILIPAEDILSFKPRSLMLPAKKTSNTISR